MAAKRKWPEGTIQVSLFLVPGTDEYEAFVRIKNRYQDEMDKRRKAHPNQLWKTDALKSEIARGGLFALDEVPQDEVPSYVTSKPKGRHSLRPDIDVSEQTDSDAKLSDRVTPLH